MPQNQPHPFARRNFLKTSAAASAGLMFGGGLLSGLPRRALAEDDRKALIAITLDLEMSAEYPTRDNTEWNFQKGNLDDDTKRYAVQAGKVAKENGGLIHYFCVGRVLEQANVDWLKELAAEGHPIGNHTYDHVYVLAKDVPSVQYRFARAPWLGQGRAAEELIRENIRLTQVGLKERCDIDDRGFRTPGGFGTGLHGREDVQQMLLELGYKWVSCKYPSPNIGPPKTEPTAEVYADIVAKQAEAQPFIYSSGLIEIPMSPVSDLNAFRTNYWHRDWWLKSTRLAIEWAIETGGVFDLLAHPSCLVVEDPQFETIQMVCDMVKKAGDRAAIVDLDTIAQRTKLRSNS
jgi:peptidoglycan/xylan/chitin deacetylase (PgdA/CDA1 family)